MDCLFYRDINGSRTTPRRISRVDNLHAQRYKTNTQNCKSREENQLDVTECFIALIICSKCFGHLYANHQELETILVLLLHMVCNDLVAGGRLLGAEQQAMCPG